jgi:septal ring factor EnvC (AmiA/AmiB activator)
MNCKSWGGRLACQLRPWGRHLACHKLAGDFLAGWKPAPLLLATLLLAGCAASGPNEQLLSCQQDKEQLLATIRQQRDANRQMHEQVASLESRLDQAEKQLAQGASGTRVSSLPVETTPLPWRKP